jgi:3-deoxy-manno-octulosonate cytidylyltransferase (CMP-KDO synthetase)
MIVGIIPARYHSTRLPGKPLLDLEGKPMIQWVYEGASNAQYLDQVIVATDDRSIFEVVEGFGGRAVMTSADHPTGTDRLAEAVKGLSCDLVVNIQGDEPLIDGEVIDQVLKPLKYDESIPMGTAMVEEKSIDVLKDPSVVKVVPDSQGFAMYFSRSLIPYPRTTGQFYRHIGLYAYRREFLLKMPELPMAPPELSESLEQLRALYHGYKIKLTEVEGEFLGVDTPEDVEMVCRIIRQRTLA